MNKKGNSSFARFLICIVYAIFSLYYIEDMKTSANVVVKQTESRGTVHLFLIMLIALLALYMLLRTVFTGKLKISDFNAPLILLVVWCTFTDLVNGANFWSIAVHIGLIVLWVLTIFFMEDIVFDKKTYNLVIRFEFVIWLITIYYSVVALTNYSNYHQEIGDGDVSSVLNISYNILVIIPFLLQIKNKLIKNISLIISCGFIILSMKRGAILALGLMFVIYYYMQVKSGKIRISFLKITSILVFFVIGFIIVNRITNNELILRFTWDSLLEGSNRNILYTAAINDVLNRNIIEFLIGKGSGSSMNIIGSGIHNEILEMIFLYGLVGLLIYLWLIVRGIKLINKLLRERNNASAIYAMSVVYIVFVGLVGTALFTHYTFHIMASIGISAGYLRKESENNEFR